MFNWFRLCRKDVVAETGKIVAKNGNSVEATFDFVCWKDEIFTIESFDIVAVCSNKVECCFDTVARSFDNVAGVDGA